MKHKICVSIDNETLLKIKEKIREGIFRNKSHAIEFSVNKIIGENNV